jgi:hypothetical protein
VIESFSIERSLFVSGLHWQVLGDKPSESKAEIRRLAHLLTYDLHVHRKTGVAQVGLAAANDGYRAGMISAAAIVSKTVELEFNERDFLCATALADGRFLYVAQSDGVMSLDKAWEFIIAPASWGIAGAVERDFLSFLPTKNGKVDLKHAWWCLTAVETSLRDYLKRYAKPLTAAGVVIGVGVAAQQWIALNAAREAERVAAELRATAEAAPRIDNPWKKMPRAMLFGRACDAVFSAQPTFWPGNWTPVSATCSLKTGALVTTWNRADMGFVEHLREMVPEAVIATDAASATRTSALPGLASGEDESLEAAARVTEQLNGTAQGLGVTLTLTVPNAVPELPGAGPVPAGSFKELVWTIQTGSLAPLPVIAAFDGPGFRVDAITAKFNGGQITWEVGGAQYVK